MILKSDPGQQVQTILNSHFFDRYINGWNSLPNSVMSAPSLNVFKN